MVKILINLLRRYEEKGFSLVARTTRSEHTVRQIHFSHIWEILLVLESPGKNKTLIRHPGFTYYQVF